MGKIRKMLGMAELDPRVVTPNMIWTDLCEDVHLHYRNNRFDFSEKEFAFFRAAINQLGMAVEMSAENSDYREGDPNFLIQQIYNEGLSPDSDYYPNRCTLELQDDNTVHFHYRDLRLHFTKPEFLKIAEIFTGGLVAVKNLKPFPYKPDKPTRYNRVDIDLVQPYDEGHRPMVIDDEHREGIEYAKSLILQAGKKLRPVLVNCDGRRLDGFKRYMAQKELGEKKLDIIVDPFGVMGGQNNMSMEDDDEPYLG